MKSTTLLASLLIAGIAVGEEKRQPLTIGKILPKATSTETSKEKPTLKIGKLVPSEQRPNTKDVPEKPRFPKHWGKPPAIQTRDMVKLPGNFGKGSSTLARWIAENLKEDAKKKKEKEKTKPTKPVDENPDPVPPIQPIDPIERPQPPKEIKEKIDFLRRKGWTLSAISDELGVGRETAYGWIARGHSPSNVKLVNLALDGLLQRNRIPKKKRYLNQRE